MGSDSGLPSGESRVTRCCPVGSGGLLQRTFSRTRPLRVTRSTLAEGRSARCCASPGPGSPALSSDWGEGMDDSDGWERKKMTDERWKMEDGRWVGTDRVGPTVSSGVHALTKHAVRWLSLLGAVQRPYRCVSVVRLALPSKLGLKRGGHRYRPAQNHW